MNEDSKHGVFGVGEVVEVLMAIETVIGKSLGLEEGASRFFLTSCNNLKKLDNFNKLGVCGTFASQD